MLNLKPIARDLRAGGAALLLLSSSATHAQIVIEEDDGYRPPSSTGEFFGKAIVSQSGGGGYSTAYQALEFGYDTRFASERGRLYFSGIGTNTDLSLELKLKSQAATDASEEERNQKLTREVQESLFNVRDAFAQFDISDNATIHLGRRRVAWGQFELVSPVNLALPITPQTTGLTSGKVDTMVPQDQLGFSWFPSERVELQAYYFNSTRMDSLFTEVLSSGGSTETVYTHLIEPDPPAGASNPDPFPNHLLRWDENTVPLLEPANDIERHSHYAARALFYMNWGTLGLTYHNGRDSLSFASDLATLECVRRGQFNDPQDYADNPITPTGPCNAEDAINLRRHTDLPEAKNFGIEVAIPSGRWVYKFELLRKETTANLEGFSVPGCTSGHPEATDRMTEIANCDRNRQNRLYLNKVLELNEGRLYLPVTSTFFAIGADSDRENWRFNLSLLGISETFENDAIIEEEKKAFNSGRGDAQVFPAINIARYIDGNKNKELGLALGFLGPFAGVSLYYKSQFRENLRYLLGVQSISSIRDQLIVDTDAEGQPAANRYDLADDFSTGLRFSLIYDF